MRRSFEVTCVGGAVLCPEGFTNLSIRWEIEERQQNSLDNPLATSTQKMGKKQLILKAM